MWFPDYIQVCLTKNFWAFIFFFVCVFFCFVLFCFVFLLKFDSISMLSVQSRQNLRCSLLQAVSQEEPSDRKPDPWPLWMAGHAQLKWVMTECSKTQIRLTGLIW